MAGFTQNSSPNIVVRSLRERTPAHGVCRLLSLATLPHVLASLLIASILLTAASLKLLSVVNQEFSLETAWPIAVATGEIALSLALLTPSRFRNYCWLAAGIAFASFALFNAYQWFTGISSCGCFGDLALAPATVLVIDLSALAILVSFPPAGTAAVNLSRFRLCMERARQFGATGIMALAVCGGTIHATNTWNDSITREVAPGVREGRNLLLLTPSQWVGHPLPITAHLDQPDLISEGDWELWLVDPACKECQSALRSLNDSALAFPSRQIALVMVTKHPSKKDPVSGKPPQWNDQSAATTVLRLRTSKLIECRVPVCVICRDARVVAVRETGTTFAPGFALPQTSFFPIARFRLFVLTSPLCKEPCYGN